MQTEINSAEISARIFSEYEKGQQFNQSLGLSEQVRINENFYIGKQWEGVNAPNLPKPVLNILKRVVSYFVAIVGSESMAVNINSMDGRENNESTKRLIEVVKNEIVKVIENERLNKKNRQALRDAAVDGDCCMHLYFDTSVKSGNLTDGAIRCEILDNTDVFFGNPQVIDVQSQPYIIISYRKQTEILKKQYPALEIVADGDENGNEKEDATGKTTVLRKYEKKGGRIYCTEVCRGCVLTPEINLEYSLYPIAWMSWERVKHSYHGQSPITSVISNQIDINRLFAMCLKQVKDGAFPKLIYNRAMFPNGWDNTVGAAIGVSGGDIKNAVTAATGVTEMSSQVVVMIDKLISYTKETMGASDAALGNVRADNTSAIIALQKSSSMPLEFQRQDFYQFCEDYVRIIYDIMCKKYGIRLVYTAPPDEQGADLNGGYEAVDFSRLEEMQFKINVDVGAGSYWSELTSINTLDNLFSKGIITDVETYLESMPSGVIPNKDGILQEVRRQKAAQEQQAQLAVMGGASGAMPEMQM